jgi:hypothetical protein
MVVVVVVAVRIFLVSHIPWIAQCSHLCCCMTNGVLLFRR